MPYSRRIAFLCLGYIIRRQVRLNASVQRCWLSAAFPAGHGRSVVVERLTDRRKTKKGRQLSSSPLLLSLAYLFFLTWNVFLSMS